MKEFIKNSLIKLKGDGLDTEVLIDTLIKTYRLLDSKEDDDYNLCLAVICHVSDAGIKDAMAHQLLHDCIIKSRIFLYDRLLKERGDDFNPFVSAQDVLAKSFYTSNKTDTTLTRPQKEIFDLFQKHKRLIVSAPTSFGKTRIIREIISHNNYKNIALIMPTVSLLSEQYQELKSIMPDYTISKSSKLKIEPDRKYLLILTPERMNILLEENPLFNVDFL